MSWYHDCSTLNRWTIDDVSEGRTFISDGNSISLNNDDITEDEGYAGGTIVKNIIVSGDFEIVTNATIPQLNGMGDGGYFALDYFINFDTIIYNSDGSNYESYLNIYTYQEDNENVNVYLYGFQESEDGIVLQTPWTGELKATRVNGVITVYIENTILWTSTWDNSAVDVIQLEYYYSIQPVGTYPIPMSNIKINDVSIIGNTTSNAYLESCTINGITKNVLNFDYDVFSYDVNISPISETTTFLLVPQDSGSTITINSIPIISGEISAPFQLNYGDNEFIINVIGEDEITIITYTININRLNNASSDATLQSLIFNYHNAVYPQTFDPNIFVYNIFVQRSRSYIRVTPTSTDPYATISYNDKVFNNGSNITISGLLLNAVNTRILEVTAQDGITIITYTLNIVRAYPNDSNFEKLNINGTDPVRPSYSEYTDIYTTVASYLTENISFNLVPYSALATATINDISVPFNVQTQLFPINIGDNVFTIQSIAYDQLHTTTKTITITRLSEIATGCDLTKLTLVNPNFDPAVTDYSLTYEWTDRIGFVADSSDLSTIKINNQDYIKDSYFEMSVNVGQNQIVIKVTAENGTEKFYNITVTVLPKSNICTLDSLEIREKSQHGDAIALSPSFNSDVFSYESANNLPSTARTIYISFTTTDNKSTVTINGLVQYKFAVLVGENIVNIKVKAEDGSTKTYTVVINVDAPSIVYNGLGTSINPYLISNVDELRSIIEYRAIPAGWRTDGSYRSNTKYFYFKQIADIDISEFEHWIPIGYEEEILFDGVYNGNGFSIIGLKSNGEESATDASGLFFGTDTWWLDDDEYSVYNLHLKDINMILKTGGAFQGYIKHGRYKNCTVSGNITAIGGLKGGHQHEWIYHAGRSGWGGDHDNVGGSVIGGFTGGTSGSAKIYQCSSSVNIYLTECGQCMIGGFLGVYNGGSVQECFSDGNFSADVITEFTNIHQPSAQLIGGFVGKMIKVYDTIKNCYSRCNVDVRAEHLVGGFVGGIFQSTQNATLTNCYSTGKPTVHPDFSYPAPNPLDPPIIVEESPLIGGFSGCNGNWSWSWILGSESGYAITGTNCYWDMETSGQNEDGGSWISPDFHNLVPVAEGRSTTQMKSESTFENWDFNLIWAINPLINDGYPYLRWQMPTTILQGNVSTFPFLMGGGAGSLIAFRW